jgi:hypothetical protein
MFGNLEANVIMSNSTNLTASHQSEISFNAVYKYRCDKCGSTSIFKGCFAANTRKKNCDTILVKGADLAERERERDRERERNIIINRR